MVGHKVFITHSSTDAWLASQLESHVIRCGAETFLDNSDVQHGDDFEELIRHAADTSSEQLVILTPWAMLRPYIWLEIGHFWWTKKRIVVLLYGLTEKEFVGDERVPVYLKKLNVLDINNIASYLDQLRGRVNGKEVHHA